MILKENEEEIRSHRCIYGPTPGAGEVFLGGDETTTVAINDGAPYPVVLASPLTFLRD